MRAYKEWWPDSACSKGTIRDEFRSNSRKAKLNCSSCPVKRDCLNYALLYGEDGIWGGTTEVDRALILSTSPQIQKILELEATRAGILERRYTMEEYWKSVREARKLAGVPLAVAQPPSGVEFVVPEEEYYIQWVS
jgi:Transcription factor WhiB.